MKTLRNWSIVVCALLFTVMSYAQVNKTAPGQNRQERKERKERLETMKAEHIRTELKLTPEENEKFWAIYTPYQNSIRTMRKEKLKDRKNVEDLTEREAADALENYFRYQEQKMITEKRMLQEISEVIGNRRTLLLNKVERDFKKKVINTNKHGNRRQK